MLSVKFSKPKEDLKYLFKFSGECFGRHIRFGISSDEFQHLKEKSRKLASNFRNWRTKVQDIPRRKASA